MKESRVISIFYLCCWIKGMLCSLFYVLGSVWMLYCIQTHTWAHMCSKPETGFHASRRTLITRGMKILTWTDQYTCIRAQQPVDYCCSHVTISFDICSFDMYLGLERFRSQILQVLQWAKVPRAGILSVWAESWQIHEDDDSKFTEIFVWIWGSNISASTRRIFLYNCWKMTGKTWNFLQKLLLYIFNWAQI